MLRRRVSRTLLFGGFATILCAALLGAPDDAAAATATGNLAVSATVIASCNVIANSLGFGNYNPLDPTDNDAATTVDVQCTNGTAYTVAMNVGLGASATVATRKMSSGGNTLNYSLYRNAGRTQVWGETVGVDTVAGTGSGAVQSINVYGRAPAGQTSPAGAYSDTVTVTVAY